ncbi:MAG: DUF4924 family protein [Flavobacteriales bacterium]|nr:DUF4924 family protein [Flavobacteriales bacterium]
MLISQSKRQTNIIEYLLYMYQIEDIIRSFQFNLTSIDTAIVQKYDQSDEVRKKMKFWYADLIDKIKRQHIERTGHLKELRASIIQLQELHDQLLMVYFDKKYIDLYDDVKPALKELTVKAVGQDLINQVDVAVHGLYGLLMLRLKQKEVGTETQNAMDKITAFLAHLAAKFKMMEAGKLELPKVQGN